MNLDHYLKAKAIKGVEFASMIGVSPVSLSRIRRGDQNITREVIRRIVDATDGDVSAQDLVFPIHHGPADTAPQHSASTGKQDDMSGQAAA